MSTGKVIGYVIAGIMIFLGGFLFLAGLSPEYGDPAWKLWGGIIVGVGLLIIVGLVLLREPKEPREIIQKIDLTGDVGMAKLKCKNCGAELEKEHISLKEGAMFVSCPYCGSDYQMVEEPKW